MEELMPVEEALERILAHFHSLDAEERPLLGALDQVLAEDVYAPFDVPPLDNSSMDGYALRAADTRGASPNAPAVLRVIGLAAAGHLPQLPVEPGTAMRIMTGAPIPRGADAVLPFEDTDELAQRSQGVRSESLTQIGVFRELSPGAYVRPAAEDVARGELVLVRGTLLRPSEIGVLASLGRARVSVTRRPVVTILATGDELAPLGRPLLPAQIYDSNSYGIAAQVLRYGGIPNMLGIARDNLTDLTEKMEKGLAADLFLTSAGVSTGEYDLVKDVLTQRGEMEFWRVRMRPGKPLAFGVLRGQGEKAVPHLGLPGNPVSSMVAFEIFVRPALLKMRGLRHLARPLVTAVAESPIRNGDGRRFYARAVVTQRDGEYYARLTGPQGSNVLTSMARANALVIVPEDQAEVKPGELVQVEMLDQLEERNTD